MMKRWIFNVVRAVAVAMIVVATASTAQACRTPVYRYAMANWPTHPYYLFHFHAGEVAAADAALHARLRQAAEAPQGPALNLAVVEIDVTKNEELETLPDEVVAAWRATDGGKTPAHLLYTAWGDRLQGESLDEGRLDEATLDALLDSPARRKLGELMHQGNAVVWIVLEGSDAAANQRAVAVVEQILADCRSGKLSSPPDEADLLDSESADEASRAEAHPPQPSDMIPTAMLRVSRDDKAEAWLVRTLLAIQPAYARAPADNDATEVDVADPDGSPRVFAFYGRGRTMPPYEGQHITGENLADCLLFLAGPCSCTLKDDNPGVDLLMHWDWDETSTVVSQADEELRASEEAGEAPASTSEPSTAPVEATRPETSVAAAETEEVASTPFARRQSSIFAVVLLSAGGLVFAGGAVLWFWQQRRR